MKTAGVREIRNSLSAYLRMVEQGERVAVTHRGTVVAELGPPTHATEEEDHSELRLRARAGTVRLGAPDRPAAIPGSAGSARRDSGCPVTLYPETSAVVAWLLDEESAGRAGLVGIGRGRYPQHL